MAFNSFKKQYKNRHFQTFRILNLGGARMTRCFRKFLLVSAFLVLFGSAEIKADTGSTGYIGSSGTTSSQSTASANSNSSAGSSSIGIIQPTSADPSQSNTPVVSSSTGSQLTGTDSPPSDITDKPSAPDPMKSIPTFTFQSAVSASSKPAISTSSSNNTASSNSTATASTTTDTSNTSTASAKSITAKSTTATTKPNALTPMDATSSGASSAGVNTNVQSASVQVQPSSGSASLSVPIAVPAGRAGIQPNLSLVYNSSNRQLGNAGYGWNLDLGSIQRSTKKGVPTYNDSQDIFSMGQNGGSQDLVADPSTPGLYHMEVEGSFANIQYFTTYWVITDKKGIKYYYGNTSDSKQSDPANPTHIFRWAVNRVEDLNGNYMTISYLNDNGQIYPQIISYTGNDTSSLILSTYAQVNISYVAASSPSTSYISEFLVKTAQRIDHITVSVGSNVQSVYTFAYKTSNYSYRDLLQSVQQTGADGSSTLPPVTFSYSDTALKGFQQDTSWNLSNVPVFSQYSNVYNSNTWLDFGVRIASLRGNGYPDIIQYYSEVSIAVFLTYSTINQVYLNTKQKNWTPTSSWQFNMNLDTISGFNIEFSAPGFVTTNQSYSTYFGPIMIDLDGDGLVDSVQNFAPNGYNNFQSAFINNGTSGFNSDNSWLLPQDILTDYWGCEFGSCNGGIMFGSINGAGFNDVAAARNSFQQSHNVYLNNSNFNSKGWTLTNQWVTPSGVDFANGCSLVSLRGDGLSDIICLSPNSVYFNTGNGWQLQSNSGYANTNGLGNLTDGSTQFIDINGDGLPDIVIANGSSNHVLINTGNGWVQDDSWAPSGANFTNLSTQFLDANANGMPGYLISTAGQSPQMYTNQGQIADLLTGVNNGIGASTSIQYDSGFHYNNTYMPYFISVVKSTTTTVGSQSYTTTYSYANGNWDTTYREFDGFGTMTATDPNGNYVTTTYLQDHWLKGHPSEQDTYDSNGNLYSKSVNTWATQTIATNSNFMVGGAPQTSKFPYLSRTDNYLYDGNSSATPKRTAQEFTYGENPQYGDPTQVVNDGQVDPTAGTSIDANKTTTNVSYVYNTNNWIIGLPAQIITQDTNGNKISQTSFYYDGDTKGTAAPSMGRLTSKVNWLGSTILPDPKTTYTYDAYGNLQTTVDPNKNSTTITYDNTVHMFPVQTTNALKQTVAMTYYGIDGVSLNAGGLQGLWGQDRSKTDANNQTAYTTYDALGRPVASISPLDTVALPTEQKSYNIQSNYIAVTDSARVNNGSSATISTVSYYDGLGRMIETKSLGPTAGQYIASDLTVFDSRGLPITKYLPHFTTNNLNTLDSIDTTVPSAQQTYDPMGRVITKTNPDGTYSSIVYNQWTSTTTDENGHMQQSIVDAFGHLVQKQEYTGADGRSPNYPASPYALYATTNYSYDPKGNLLSVTDNKNNVTTITYDNLGRKIAMNDPDMGNWQYGYDGNNNLIWQGDAKKQVISFTYDALNRLKNKTDAITGPIVNLPNLPLQPATFNVNYNFDDPTQSFGIGRLGSVNYDSGKAGFIYDQIGREVSSKKTIDGTTYNLNRQYDALNRLQQLQYPDGSQVTYVYNQAGQVSGVADAGAVVNGGLVQNTSNIEFAKNSSWFEKNVLGIGDAYAGSNPVEVISLTKSPSNAGTITGSGAVSFSCNSSCAGYAVSYMSGTETVTAIPASGYIFAGWSGSCSGTGSCVVTTGASSKTVIAKFVLTSPKVTLSVANNGRYAAPATVNLTATVSEKGGTISRVDFYNGTTLLGSSNTSPYTFSWNNVPAGSYSLTAEAYDNNGIETTSSAISINVTTPNLYIQSINYNATGQITQIQYGNGTVTAYTYNSLNFRLMRIYTSNTQAQVIQDLNYTYDSIGQVLTITDNANTGANSMTQSFVYDALNRLISASGSYGSKTYAYDSIGNITLKDGLTYKYSEAGSRIDGSTAGPHAATSLSDGTVFKYDLNGNMVSLKKGGNLTKYVYDSQNRLQSVSVGGLTIATYVYDGDGGRIKKIVYRRDLALYNDNVNALLFGNLNGTPRPATAGNPTVDTTRYVGNVYETEGTRQTKFIYLGSTRVAAGSDGSVFYYHTDHLGGTNVLTDNTGVLRELIEYDPFGQVITHEKYGNDFATIWYYFTGKPLDDETGLVFLGSRYYNPSLGRFITPDTVVQAPSNPQTLNRYTYCNNNPVNLVDPTGHSWFSNLFKDIGKFFSNLVKNIVRVVIDVVAIVAACVCPALAPVAGWIIAGSSLDLLNAGTSSWQGGGWDTFHQVVGYASMACAAAAAFQEIYQAYSAAQLAQTYQSIGLSNSAMAPSMTNMSSDELMSIMNNSSSGITVVDRAAAAEAEIALANGTGSVVAKSVFGGATGSWGAVSGAETAFNAANKAATVLQVAGLAGLAIPGVGEVEGGAILLDIGGNLGTASGLAQAYQTGDWFRGITSFASWGIGNAASAVTKVYGTVWSSIAGSLGGSGTTIGSEYVGSATGHVSSL